VTGPADDRIPGAVLALGWAGVIPFAGLALAAVAGIALPLVPLPALAAYGTAILSFMGGAQWGLAMRTAAGARGYAVSVLPALLGWVALLLPARPGLVLLAAGFALLLGYDLWTVRRGEAPAWYAHLRAQLTGAVVLILLAAALLARP
jgi:hypothetical protein